MLLLMFACMIAAAVNVTAAVAAADVCLHGYYCGGVNWFCCFGSAMLCIAMVALAMVA